MIDVCAKDGLAFLPWYPLPTGAGQRGGARADRRAPQATTAQIALAWLLRRSPSMLPIPGTSSIAHFEENWAARGLALSDEDYAAVWPCPRSPQTRRCLRNITGQQTGTAK